MNKSCFFKYFYLVLGMFFDNKIRYLILAISTVCMMLVSVNSILLNFTIICMDNGDGQSMEANNSMLEPQHREPFSPFQRSALFSATAFGALLGGLPINFAVARYTLRHTIAAYGFLSALATLATPLGHKFVGFPALLFTRIVQGTAFPAEYIMNSMVSRKWATVGSTGTFLLLISSHSQLGPIYAMPAAGHFCESKWGWAGIYYVQGALTMAFFAAFLFLFRDNPNEHPFVTERELKQIEAGKTREADRKMPPPYRAILSDWAVWLLLLAFFSDEIGFQFYTQMGPYYLNKVLGIGVVGTGLFAALPYPICVCTKLITGPLNDHFLSKFFSEHARIKLFTAISQYGIVTSLACLAYIPLVTNSLGLILPFYATLNMFTGLNILGVFRCTQTIALQHSEVLITWASMVSSFVALVLPSIVSLMAPNNDLGRWTILLSSIAFTVLILNTAFTFFGKTTPSAWAQQVHDEEGGRKEKETF